MRRTRLGLSVIDRFWDKVQPEPNTGCWLWAAHTDHAGYGRFGAGRRGDPIARAHRWAYEYFVGPIPTGLWVLHKCDQPSCVNPAHLFLGDHADNMRDAVRKGRMSSGERRPMAKLTEAGVRLIRQKAATLGKRGWKRDLARELGVSPQAVSGVLSSQRWKHVK